MLVKEEVKGYVVGYKSERIKLRICELSSLNEVSPLNSCEVKNKNVLSNAELNLIRLESTNTLN